MSSTPVLASKHHSPLKRNRELPEEGAVYRAGAETMHYEPRKPLYSRQ